MYEAKNHKELKKVLEEGKSPILVRDKKTIKIVETLESLKRNGFVGTLEKKAIDNILREQLKSVLSESGILVLGGMSIAGILGLYAIYKKMPIKFKRNNDGSIEVSIG